tara:strand:- start:889 stop:1482 length:594 start_codon:yes stop_codon:yes gene_type:complete
MRIISGKFKGTNLYGPFDKKIRPLKDMVRESIFNFLIHSKKFSFKVKDSNILDLYSGTGSFGLECLSREADKVIFIEKDQAAISILEKNINKLKVKDSTKIFAGDVNNILDKNKTFASLTSELKVDLIFCDPPFKEKEVEKLFKLVIAKNILKKKGIIIFHRHKTSQEKIERYFKIVDERIYGLSKIIVAQPNLFSI